MACQLSRVTDVFCGLSVMDPPDPPGSGGVAGGGEDTDSLTNLPSRPTWRFGAGGSASDPTAHHRVPCEHVLLVNV